MDLMNLLRSIEALLYELVSWLVFYPITLWRCLRHPHAMMAHAEAQLKEPPEAQFQDAISPPLFLFLTLFLSHLIGNEFSVGQHILAGPLQDERNLLIFQAVLFSLFPLLVALQKVRMTGARLTRSSLRPAFYSQCYLAAPFVLIFDLASIVGPHGDVAASIAALCFVLGLFWYLAALTLWFKLQRRTRLARAFLRALGTFLTASLGLALVALLVAYGMGRDAVG